MDEKKECSDLSEREVGKTDHDSCNEANSTPCNEHDDVITNCKTQPQTPLPDLPAQSSTPPVPLTPLILTTASKDSTKCNSPQHSPIIKQHSVPTTPQVDSYSISKIEQARERVKRSFDRSKLLADDCDEYIFPRFEWDELKLGKILGKGGFGTVLEIMGVEDRRHEVDSLFGEDGSHHNFHATNKNDDNVMHTKRKKSHSFRIIRKRTDDEDGEEHIVSGCRSMDGMDELPADGMHHQETNTATRSKSVSWPKAKANAYASHFFHLPHLPHHHKHPDEEEKRAGHSNDDSNNESNRDVLGSNSTDELAAGSLTEGRRHKLTKALSWSSAKAHAHDVSQFFHLHHHQKDNGVSEPIIEEDSNFTDDSNSNKNVHGEMQREVRKKQISCDDSMLNRRSNTSGGSRDESKTARPRDTRAKRIPGNFSFQAWRNSDAGSEGDDAIPQEEYERMSRRNSEVAPENRNAISLEETVPTNDCLTFVDCLGYSAAVVDDKNNIVSGAGENKGSVVSSDSDRADESVTHGKTNNADPSGSCNNRRRRCIIVPPPFKDGVSFSPEDASKCHAYHQDKQFITDHTTTSDGSARYVIKIITPEIVQNNFKKFLQAAMDMATETYFLSVLKHPHIITMRAVGQGDMFSPQYFLVLDRLYDTLEDRIENTWHPELDKLENHLLVWNRLRKTRMLWEERMKVAKDLAGALLYLHELGIIYRDVKPENVGFDSRGIVKLFDFGLAKEVHKEDECAGGTYKLTANTGSLRYMAPEVCNKWPYNFFADSYSFGIMLWEIAALEKPFARYTQLEIKDMVLKWGERPTLKEDWSDRMKQLMQNSWDSNFRKRPTMKEFVVTLEQELAEEHA